MRTSSITTLTHGWRARTLLACTGLIAAQAVVAGTALAGPTESWGLDRMDQRHLPRDGDFSPDGTGPGVNIYVVGSGILFSHDDFENRASNFYDFEGGSGVDCNGLGTYLASLAGGSTWGVASDATVHGVRVEHCSGAFQPSELVLGLNAIAENGALPGVVVLSTVWCDSYVNNAIQHLINSGFTVVIPAPLNNTDFCDPVCTPTLVPDAIVVGVIDENDSRAALSNYGPCVDIFAPGMNVKGAWPTSDTDTNVLSGSVSAAAYVAGVAAEYLGAAPSMTPVQVQAMLLERATLKGPCDSPEEMAVAYTGFDVYPPCPADFDRSGDVGFTDLTRLLSAWGPCEGCCEDIDEGEGEVSFADLTLLLSAWGPCS